MVYEDELTKGSFMQISLPTVSLSVCDAFEEFSIVKEQSILIVYNFIVQALCLAKYSFLAMFHHFSQCDTYFIQCMDAFSYEILLVSRSTCIIK